MVRLAQKIQSSLHMKIDRERFLLLSAALAAGVGVAQGCNNAQSPPADDPRTRAGWDSSYQPATGPGYVEVPASVAPLPAPPVASFPAATTPQPTPPSTSTAATVATAEVSTVAPKSPNPYDGTPVTAQACSPALNSVGTPSRCALTAPGPQCESFGDTVQECPTLTRLLKPRVAEAAIACLQRKSGTREICEFNITSICAYEALGSACLEPSAKTACNSVVAKCSAGPRGNYNKMTRESCEAGVSGIADAKRRKFISCISESCRFETCLTYL
jgi:hypothetical protein